MTHQPPIKVTICPPAFAAPCSATLHPDHIAAIRAHNDAMEAAYQARAGSRKMPIVYGKKRPLFPRAPKRENNYIDIVEELYG